MPALNLTGGNTVLTGFVKAAGLSIMWDNTLFWFVRFVHRLANICGTAVLLPLF